MIDTFSRDGQHEVASKFSFDISASTLDSGIFLEILNYHSIFENK
jgi:hypothetical protein